MIYKSIQCSYKILDCIDDGMDEDFVCANMSLND